MDYAMPAAGDGPIWDVWLSQHYLPAVTAAGEVGLWRRLGDRALPLDALAAELGVEPRALGVVLGLLCALGFVERREGAFRLTRAARTYLDPASPFHWGPVLFGGAAADPVHARLVELLRATGGDAAPPAGTPAAGWESGRMDEAQAAHVAAFMHAHSLVAAIGAARSGAFAGVGRLMDVGGGSGVYAIAAAQADPGLRATVMDLPAMCVAAARFIAEGGVAGRVATAGVDMWREPWPEGHDALFFSNIFHDWNEDQNGELAARAFAALPPGGRIILHEQLLDDAEDGPLTPASFSVLMLRGTWGRQYSLPALRRILAGAGFAGVEARHSCGYYSLVTAVRP